MPLPAFASIDDLAVQVPGGVSDDDSPRAQATLNSASTKIRLAAGKTWVDEDGELVVDIPDIVAEVCVAAAFRAFTNPSGVSQDAAGPFSTSYVNASPDVYLTKQERADIQTAAGSSGLWAQGVTRGPIETKTIAACGDGEYLPVDPAGTPIPFT